jgi:hypothetical protein
VKVLKLLCEPLEKAERLAQIRRKRQRREILADHRFEQLPHRGLGLGLGHGQLEPRRGPRIGHWQRRFRVGLALGFGAGLGVGGLGVSGLALGFLGVGVREKLRRNPGGVPPRLPVPLPDRRVPVVFCRRQRLFGIQKIVAVPIVAVAVVNIFVR